MHGSNLIIIALLLFLLYITLSKRHRFGFKKLNTAAVKILPSVNRDKLSDNPVTTNINTEANKHININSSDILSNHEGNQVRFKPDYDIVLRSDTVVDAFSPKVDYASDLGISQEALDQLVKEYQDKYMTEKKRTIPRNMHFNKDQFSIILNSNRDSAISYANRKVRKDTDGDDLNEAMKKLAYNRSVDTDKYRVSVSAPTKSKTGRRHIPISV